MCLNDLAQCSIVVILFYGNGRHLAELQLPAVGQQPAGTGAAGALKAAPVYLLGDVQFDHLPPPERFTLMTGLQVCRGRQWGISLLSCIIVETPQRHYAAPQTVVLAAYL